MFQRWGAKASERATKAASHRDNASDLSGRSQRFWRQVCKRFRAAFKRITAAFGKQRQARRFRQTTAHYGNLPSYNGPGMRHEMGHRRRPQGLGSKNKARPRGLGVCAHVRVARISQRSAGGITPAGAAHRWRGGNSRRGFRPCGSPRPFPPNRSSRCGSSVRSAAATNRQPGAV